MQLIILRPQPAAETTMARANALGFDAVSMPLFALEPVDWTLPDGTFDAVLITSANALRNGGAGLSAITYLPVLAVGDASAKMAKSAGFDVAITGNRDGAAILAQAINAGFRNIIWLAGAEHMPLDADPEISLTTIVTYQSRALDPSPDLTNLLAIPCVVALHSARAAAYFSAYCEQYCIDIAHISLAVLSPAIAAAAGTGWRQVAIADAPNDMALLSAAQSIAMTISNGEDQ
jgi:uroporphyrinogen-III synthase